MSPHPPSPAAQHGGQGTPGLCLPNNLSGGGRLPGWLIALITVAAALTTAAAGLLLHRWRARREMREEIRAVRRRGGRTPRPCPRAPRETMRACLPLESV